MVKRLRSLAVLEKGQRYLVAFSAVHLRRLGGGGPARRPGLLAGERAVGVLAALVRPAGVQPLLALVHVPAGVVGVEEAAGAAGRDAVVAAHRVAAHLARQARLRILPTLVYICRVSVYNYFFYSLFILCMLLVNEIQIVFIIKHADDESMAN